MKWLILTVAAGVASCGGKSLSIDLSNITVQLDVYSGLPNPRWQLSEEDASQLEDRLNGLPETGAVEIPNPLGYRGFMIQDAHGRRLTVSKNGYVVVHENSRDKFYRDTKEVQVWLKRQAKARGFGSLLMEPQ